MESSAKNYGAENHNQNHDRVTPLPELIERIRRQIEFDAFSALHKEFAEEIVRIIAEVYRLRPDAEITIAGEKLPVDLVQEVYLILDHDNVEQVICDYIHIPYEIRAVKTYLRTALYNSSFEMNNRIFNQVKANNG